MPHTRYHRFPYPSSDWSPAGAEQIQQLAEAVDVEFDAVAKVAHKAAADLVNMQTEIDNLKGELATLSGTVNQLAARVEDVHNHSEARINALHAHIDGSLVNMEIKLTSTMGGHVKDVVVGGLAPGATDTFSLLLAQPPSASSQLLYSIYNRDMSPLDHGITYTLSYTPGSGNITFEAHNPTSVKFRGVRPMIVYRYV